MTEEHPIQELMTTALENIKDMVDVDTIIGDPIETPDQSVIILPVSKVGFGFASGGSEFSNGSSSDSDSSSSRSLPFGGGAGGGVSITPIGFLIVRENDIQMVHMNDQTHILEKLIELAPQAVDYAKKLVNEQAQNQGGRKKRRQSRQDEEDVPTTPE